MASGAAPNDGKKHPPGFTKDMLEPLLFPKHQPHFKMFSYFVCFAIGYYMVFVQDYGPKENIFTPVRRFRARMVKNFFDIDPEDKEVQAAREELMKKNQRTDNSDVKS